MNHASDDTLLLYAYGEAAASESTALAEHLAHCEACRARFRVLAEGREAVTWAMEASSRRPARRVSRVAWAALPLAAALAALLWWRVPGERNGSTGSPDRPVWSSHVTASPEAGYVTGTTLIAIDSQLVRLEQRRSYGSRLD
jgi:hypothetical protein